MEHELIYSYKEDQTLSVVVISPEPFRGLILCLFYPFKDVLIQPFVAYRTIVALDIRILLRLAWLDLLDVNAPCLSPCFEQTTAVFWAVVDTNVLGFAASLDDLVQAEYDTHSWQRELHFGTQHLAIVIVQHIEGSELATICKLILHEIYGSSLVWGFWHN